MRILLFLLLASLSFGEQIELLVCNFTANGYEPGCIQTVRRSPTNWGKYESLREWVRQGNPALSYPGYFRVIITDIMTFEEAQRLLEAQYQILSVEDIANPGTFIDQVVPVKPRRCRIRVEQLPGRLQGVFNTETGEVGFNNPGGRAAFLAAIRDIENPTEIVDITVPLVRPTLPPQANGN